MSDKDFSVTVELPYDSWAEVGAGLVLMASGGSETAAETFKSVATQVAMADAMRQSTEDPMSFIEQLLRGGAAPKERPEGA